MKILIILKFIPDTLSHHKSDVVFSTIQSHLAARHDVTLLTTGPEAETEFPVHAISLSKVERGILKVFRKISLDFHERYLSWVVARQVSPNGEKKYDAALAYCLDRVPAIHAKAIKDRCGLPYIIREHQSHYDRFYEKSSEIPLHHLRALREAEAVTAVSPILARRIEDIGVRESVSVIPNSICDDFFIPPSEQSCFLDEKGGYFTFGGWTKWREIKRIDLLLEAFLIAYRKYDNLRLIVVGPIYPESDRKWAEQFVEDNGLADAVCLYGPASREIVHGLAHAVDCCVIPSDYETFGLPAMEAMAAGSPSVVTACNGPESVIDDDRLGRVVKRGCPEALAKGMIEIYEKRASFDPEHIRETARARYSEKVVGAMFSRFYEYAVGKSGANNMGT